MSTRTFGAAYIVTLLLLVSGCQSSLCHRPTAVVARPVYAAPSCSTCAPAAPVAVAVPPPPYYGATGQIPAPPPH